MSIFEHVNLFLDSTKGWKFLYLPNEYRSCAMDHDSRSLVDNKYLYYV
jgi:hypothetical protein